MQQNATSEQIELSSLRPEQIKVIGALSGGAPITKAADIAGVDRTTVHRWFRSDTAFQAAWNAVRRDFQREVDAQLNQLAQDAIGAVQAALQVGDARIGPAVLKGLGVLSGVCRSIGPEDPLEIEAEEEIQAKERSALRFSRRLMAL